MPPKMNPFAFCGLDKNKNPIIKDLDNVDPSTVPGTIVSGTDEPPGQHGKAVELEMAAFAKNPTWVYIGGRWFKIG